MKHTPGPWNLSLNDCHTGHIATVYFGSKGYQEIWSPEWPDAETQDGNARLIASAPDLYEACVEEDWEWEVYSILQLHAGHLCELFRKKMSKQKQAIAKAEGETI